ncbi:restriction endonuclease [Thermodesulfatator autotrophicus]|uniref:restriction endonuclease n=1 Tax=Thermodesulfatator autotrophicus TaxID=1795632 RepID=UPI000A7F26CD|nr:restriction endonuclease [Thermodesulfatator autotrophicus]
MAIPDYQSCMFPLLEFLSDQKEHSLREAVDYLATRFNLTEDELKQLFPTTQQPIFNNRVAWARTYLKQAGLIEKTRRGYFKITQRGLEVLKQKPEKIDTKFLEQFKEFRDFRQRRRKNSSGKTISGSGEKTPEEVLEDAYENLRENLAKELLQQIKKCPPSLFEKIVVDLLVRMGYGGSRKDAGQAIGKTRDEGIDGIIKEDKLGLDVIYIQAKRWDNTVGRPEIQKFVGALQAQRAKKGVFITTSSFSKEAIEYVAKIDTKVILIDGEQLAQYMVDNDVGVSTVAKYEIKNWI